MCPFTGQSCTEVRCVARHSEKEECWIILALAKYCREP